MICYYTEEANPQGSVYISLVKGVSERFKRIGSRYYKRTISINNTLLVVHSLKRGQKEIYSRWHNVSMAFLGKVAVATLVKQADLWPCGFLNKEGLGEKFIPTCL
jgi:hypothetical protein